MKKLLILTSSICFGFQVIAQEKTDLTVKINDIKDSGTGQIVFMLFDQSDGFPREVNKAFRKGIVTNFSNTASYTFTKVAAGSYAIAVFQDKNRNGEIDSNFIGMPKEPVGASNMTKMGKPSFKKCAFQYEEASKEMIINFIND